MSTEPLDIVVSDKGTTKVVTRNLEELGKAGQRAQSQVGGMAGKTSALDNTLGRLNRTSAATTSSLNSMTYALRGVIAYLGIKELARTIDIYTQMHNRLRLVTNGSEELEEVYKRLVAVSKESYSSLETTVGFYQKLATAGQRLGLSQERLLGIQESINKAVSLSGTNAQSASAGLYQLSQAFNKGKLDGDELRSALENLPMVAKVLADQVSNGNVGALQKLGAEGKLTVNDLVAAFENGTVKIEELWKDMTPTISQSLTNLHTSFIDFVGGLAASTGFAEKLASVIQFLADNFDTIGRVVLAASIILGTVFAVRAIGAAIAGVRALTVAIAANPLGAMAVALLTISSLLITFGDQIMMGGGHLASLADVATVVWNRMKSGLDRVVGWFKSFFDYIGVGSGKSFGEMGFSIVGTVKSVAWFIDKSMGLFVGFYQAVKKIGTLIGETFGNALQLALGKVVKFFQDSINLIIKGYNVLSETLGGSLGSVSEIKLFDIPAPDFKGIGEMGKEVGKAFMDGYKGVTVTQDFLGGILGEADQVAQARKNGVKPKPDLTVVPPPPPGGTGGSGGAGGADKGKSFSDIISEIRQETELLKLNTREREIQQAIFQAEEQMKRKMTAGELELFKSISQTNQALKDSNYLKEQITDLENEATVLRAVSSERETLSKLISLSTSLGRELTDVEKEQFTALYNTNEQLKRQNDMLDSIEQPLRSYQDSIRTLDELLDSGAISMSTYVNEMDRVRLEFLEGQTDVASGIERAFMKANQNLSDSASQIEGIITQTLQRTEDALVEFTMTGKMNFKELIDSFLADMFRLQLRKQLMGPLSAGLSSLFGGGGGFSGGMDAGPALSSEGFSAGASQGFSGSYGLSNFATGGEFTVGGSGGIDSQRVSFNASPMEKIYIRKPGETDAMNSRSGSQPVQVNVYNNTDAKATTQERTGPGGEKIIDVIVQKAKTELVNDVMKGGSSMNRAMEVKYGLNPANGVTQ